MSLISIVTCVLYLQCNGVDFCVVFSHFQCKKSTNFLQTNRAIIMSVTRLSSAVVLLMVMMMMMLLRLTHGQGTVIQ